MLYVDQVYFRVDTVENTSSSRRSEGEDGRLISAVNAFIVRKGIGDMKISKIDHVGIIVNDLSAAKAFFLDFGLEVQGEGELEGEWLDQIIGLHDVKTA